MSKCPCWWLVANHMTLCIATSWVQILELRTFERGVCARKIWAYAEKNICRTTRLHKICPLGTEKPMVSGSLRGWLYQCNINIINRDEAKHLFGLHQPFPLSMFPVSTPRPREYEKSVRDKPGFQWLRINLWQEQCQWELPREQYQNLLPKWGLISIGFHPPLVSFSSILRRFHQVLLRHQYRQPICWSHRFWSLLRHCLGPWDSGPDSADCDS